MLKFVTALSAALIVGWALVGSAGTASADGYRHGGYGGCCGPIRPSYSTNTVYKHKHIKKYHDVYRHKYFKRYKKYVHITKVQPIIHVHKVTRVHTKLIGVVVPVHKRMTKWLPPRVIVTTSTVHLRPTCGCGGGGYGDGGHGGGGYGKY
ncbi:MAG: hypothetical protein WDO17_02660 [Alphaproteobacteria bacterium]